MSELREALARFDGTHTAELVEASEMALADLAELVRLCEDAEVAVAATWVVKALIEKGDAVDLRLVFATLGAQRDWAAQLHILQCVQYAPEAAVVHIEAICDVMDAKKVLVRVWALDAFVRVANVAPTFRVDASAAVGAALEAKAASLRARARALKDVCALW